MNNLTGAQIERLGILSEECGEVIQVIGKILRHGYDSSSPNRHPLGDASNRLLLANEITDVILAAGIVGSLDFTDVTAKTEERVTYSIEKIDRLNKYMHYEENKLGDK